MNDRSGTAAILRPSELKPNERSRGARIIPLVTSGIGRVVPVEGVRHRAVDPPRPWTWN